MKYICCVNPNIFNQILGNHNKLTQNDSIDLINILCIQYTALMKVKKAHKYWAIPMSGLLSNRIHKVITTLYAGESVNKFTGTEKFLDLINSLRLHKRISLAL